MGTEPHNEDPTASAIGWVVVIILLKVIALLVAAGGLIYMLVRLLTAGGYF